MADASEEGAPAAEAAEGSAEVEAAPAEAVAAPAEAVAAPAEAVGAPVEAVRSSAEAVRASAEAPTEAPGVPADRESAGAPVSATASHSEIKTPPAEPDLGAPQAASSPIDVKTSVTVQKTSFTTPEVDTAEGEKPVKTSMQDVTPKTRPSQNKEGRAGSRLDDNKSFSKGRASKEQRRKQSNYFSMMSIKRGSFSSYQERTKTPRYMNTYKLESERPFNGDKVHAIIAKVLKDTIEDSMTYDPETCPGKAKLASSLIRTKVKEQDFERYKLVCLVTIGEKKSYDIFSGVRFLWDSERDRFATYMHENMYVFAVASVFGLYYE